MRHTSWLALAALLAAACGSVSNPSADGGPSDGDSGAGEPDAAVPGPVAVRVLSEDGRRQPLSEVPVAFFQPDGSLAQVVTTDQDGLASAEIAAGGAVLAFATQLIEGGPGYPRAMGVLDVHPGDEITLGGPSYFQLPPTHSMQLQTPTASGATTYFVETPCGYFPGSPDQGAGLVTYSIDFYDTCNDSPFSLVASARSADGLEQKTLVHSGVEIADQTTFAASAEWQDLGTTLVSIDGMSADLRVVGAQYVRGIVGGSAMPTSLFDVREEVSSATLSLNPRHVSQLDSALLHVRVNHEQSLLGQQILEIWADERDEIELPFDELLLPWFGTPLVDLGSHSITVPQVGAGEWDATYLFFNWYTRREGELVEGYWTLVVPPGVTSAVFPAVPEEFADWLPADIDDIYAYGKVIERSDLDGWHDARQLGLDPFHGIAPEGTANVRTSFMGGAD
ncbi:MAG TPA: hypothetical protein VKZ63_10020 [Kofleriaceae bacterium]|nr:hypothetical protein [Kofleriaceae bacterium]